MSNGEAFWLIRYPPSWLVGDPPAHPRDCLLTLTGKTDVEHSVKVRQAAWLLERRFHREYGRREHVTVSGDDAQPLVVSAVQRLELIVKHVVSDPRLSNEIDAELARRNVTPKLPA
jgi:hypothetical protein